MSTQNYQALDKIRNGSDRYKVLGRITRLWESVNLSNKYTREVLSLEFLLLDAKGTHIHVVLLKKYFMDFGDILQGNVLKEGNIYTLEKFDVWFAKSYRPVEHDHKIFFKTGTLIAPINEEGIDIARHKFAFSQFDTVSSQVGDKTHLIDVIGLLKSVGNITPKFGTVFQEIVIMDKSEMELTITLWGQLTAQLPEDIFSQQSVIVIATSLNAKEIQGKICLSSLSATKVYLNLDVADVTAYRNSLEGTHMQIDHLDPSTTLGLSEEELLRNRRVSLDKLKEMGLDESHKGETYTCRATIGYIFNTNWYYNSCSNSKCNKKVADRVCPDCGVEVGSRSERYMLRMDVEDPSGVTLFVAFDREAEYLIQKPVKELVDSYKKENGPQAVQTALEQVAGKEFIFQVKINYYSQNKENQSFVIYKIFPTTVDDDTIKKETIEKDKTNRSTDLYDGLIGVEVSSQAMESELPLAKKKKIM